MPQIHDTARKGLQYVHESQSHSATDGQSVSMSWCQAQILDI
jgi:hypothetical protein